MTYLFEQQFNEMKEESRRRGVEEGRAEMTYVFERQFNEMKEESRCRGVEEGHVEGQRQLLVTLAADRFGGTAANRVSEALNGQPTDKRLAEVGKLIVACKASDELLDRLSGQ